MDFVTSHFGKMKLWRVEHFHNIFVLTFGRDCYCIQQSRPKVRTNMLWKCSTGQSFIFPKWLCYKIHTLVCWSFGKGFFLNGNMFCIDKITKYLKKLKCRSAFLAIFLTTYSICPKLLHTFTGFLINDHTHHHDTAYFIRCCYGLWTETFGLFEMGLKKAIFLLIL